MHLSTPPSRGLLLHAPRRKPKHSHNADVTKELISWSVSAEIPPGNNSLMPVFLTFAFQVQNGRDRSVVESPEASGTVSKLSTP